MVIECKAWHKAHPEPESYVDRKAEARRAAENNPAFKKFTPPFVTALGWRYTECPYCGKSNWRDE